MMERRLRALEVIYRARPCPTCRDWPALVIVFPDEPAPPAQCPACGRDASHIIRFTDRDDGPQ